MLHGFMLASRPSPRDDADRHNRCIESNESSRLGFLKTFLSFPTNKWRRLSTYGTLGIPSLARVDLDLPVHVHCVTYGHISMHAAPDGGQLKNK